MITHEYIIEFSAALPRGKMRRFRGHVAVVATKTNPGKHALQQVIEHCALLVLDQTGCAVRHEDIEIHVMAPVPPACTT